MFAEPPTKAATSSVELGQTLPEPEGSGVAVGGTKVGSTTAVAVAGTEVAGTAVAVIAVAGTEVEGTEVGSAAKTVGTGEAVASDEPPKKTGQFCFCLSDIFETTKS
jgi:hypothetical protein